VVDASDRVVGEVTSGTISPTLGKAVMLALVERKGLAADALLRAVVRDKRPLLERVTLPFVPKRYRR
jgi:aminomethyltransferase